MRKTVWSGVCLLALFAMGVADDASARKSSKCANAIEVAALQTAAVQQELMDAALGCGESALHKFNRFQVAFGPELRRSDKTLLSLFKRVYGPVKGDAQYNLFKTNMASKAEIRRVHGVADFCAGADLVFAAALAAEKPSLVAFVSGVPTRDSEAPPIGSCDIYVAVTLQGAMTGAAIVPTPNPLRVAVAEPLIRTPADLTISQPRPSTTAAEQKTEVAAEQKAAEEPKEKKKSGFLSGLFH
ncbi:MAG TPA: hypothetical protein VG819_03710 [Rhizomicrobium sp.]|jgi:hypothetical protein|nr:hypothetical protein [Rhizomicrobium sp.]